MLKAESPSVLLIYIQSRHIVEFVRAHPVTWGDRKGRRRGGTGDRAGVPPIASMQLFLEVLGQHKGLVTQGEFFSYCVHRWGDWFARLTAETQGGLKAKAYGNFYPSAIDSLHVWAMLCESGDFTKCFWDSVEDVVGGSDLSVFIGERCCHVGLIAGTSMAREDLEYKQSYRGRKGIDVVIPMKPRDSRETIGNKMWYTIDQFDPVFSFFDEKWGLVATRIEQQPAEKEASKWEPLPPQGPVEQGRLIF